MNDLARTIALIWHEATTTDNKALASVVETYESGYAQIEERRALLRSEGNLTLSGIDAELAPMRDQLRSNVEKAIDALDQRTQNLEGKAARTKPEPTHKLDPSDADAMLRTFMAKSRGDRFKDIASMHDQPKLAAAIAQADPDVLRYLGVPALAIERAAAVAHGATRAPDGTLQYPNHRDHENLQRARRAATTARRLLDFINN